MVVPNFFQKRANAIRDEGPRSVLSVAHISHSDGDGGAARGAYTLHATLRSLGIASNFVVARRRTTDGSVIGPETSLQKALGLANQQVDRSVARAFGSPRDDFSTNVFASRAALSVHELQPSLVHLHWIGLGTLRPEQVRRFSVPVVWTLRDMWAFTGGCHYDHGCNRFQTRCGACPVLSSRREWDLSTFNQFRKIRAFSRVNLHLVALSDWMAAQARKSRALRDFRISVIPPGIDLNEFRPLDKIAARSVLGLPKSAEIVLFPALNPAEPRKGWGVLREALTLVTKEPSYSNLLLAVGGDAPEETFRETSTRTIMLGKIRDDRIMRGAYSAADVTVVPSLEEAFGKVSIESLACGTPVVAFRDTGVTELIRHRATGYLAEHGSPEDLARGIIWSLHAARSMRIAAEIERDRHGYSAVREARAYIVLYQKIIDEVDTCM